MSRSVAVSVLQLVVLQLTQSLFAVLKFAVFQLAFLPSQCCYMQKHIFFQSIYFLSFNMTHDNKAFSACPKSIILPCFSRVFNKHAYPVLSNTFLYIRSYNHNINSNLHHLVIRFKWISNHHFTLLCKITFKAKRAFSPNKLWLTHLRSILRLV